MTSPVQMDYRDVTTGHLDGNVSWKMSFLYRTPDMGAAGEDSANTDIKVVDRPEVTVLSIG